MTPTNQTPVPGRPNAKGTPVDWKALYESRLSSEAPREDTPRSDGDYEEIMQAVRDTEAFAEAAGYPDEYQSQAYAQDASGGNTYASSLSPTVQDALVDIVKSISRSESAGSWLIKASADIIDECIVVSGNCDMDIVTEAMEAAHKLAQTVSSMECILSKKLCCTLTSLSDCGQSPSGPTCFAISEDMEVALSSVVDSVAQQESSSANLIQSGFNVMKCVEQKLGPTASRQVLDMIVDLADANADIETSLERKLCLSLGAITSCDPKLPSSLNKPLENLISSITDSEYGAADMISGGAYALTEAVATCDEAEIRNAIDQANILSDAALRIEEATMRKLCMALSALCGEDIASQIDCELGGCQDYCGSANPSA
ncbi:MAG: hypothetical protein LBH66_02370 [Oscillospiraceae bacterium]|jgi:hypothetical protein|nr:hypothetical protein [Oscillospiraceae bacterium]